MSDDIVTRLRRIGPDVYGPAAVLAATEAADEIERLRERDTLTNAERQAILIVRACAVTRAERFLTQSDREREATLTLIRLLERMG